MNKEELNKAIKVVIKTKESNIKPKQARAIDLLKHNGFDVVDNEDSSYNYLSVALNGRSVVVSKITDSRQSGVFINGRDVDTFWHDRVVNTNHGQYRKLSTYFDKVDYFDLLTKVKYPQAEPVRTRTEQYKTDNDLWFKLDTRKMLYSV